jgi:hypothetical protein
VVGKRERKDRQQPDKGSGEEHQAMAKVNVSSATREEPVEHARGCRSVEGTAELGQLLIDLLHEQVQHNLRVALALGQAIAWDEVAQAQTDFVRASFERLDRLSSCHLELLQATMGATASAGSDDARKAA